MFSLLLHKTELQKLQDRYCRLMRSSYDIALTDKKRSDLIHDEAQRILDEIHKLKEESLLKLVINEVS